MRQHALSVADAIPSPSADVVTSPRRLARLCTRSLWDELALYPKPGLVSLRDRGAHGDMDAGTFVRSLFCLRRYYSHIALLGAQGASFSELRIVGMRAEQVMLATTGGINTHRGAIFVLGLLCAAAGRAAHGFERVCDDTVRASLSITWGPALDEHAERNAYSDSHGAQVGQRYATGGAIEEAQRGFPAVFEIALPALRAARRQGHSLRLARLSAFFALLEHVTDTNVLYRSGSAGLHYVQAAARRFRMAGDVQSSGAIRMATLIHRSFIALGISPGGCADLLAATLFMDALQTVA